MIDPMIRSVPLSFFRPLRQAVRDLPRWNPVRIAATIVLRRAALANRHHLAGRLTEIRPLDEPMLSFEAVDSMVMDAVFWFGVRGYEGTAARIWTDLCQRAESVLEIGGNVGLFSVLGARASSGIYTAVEPVPVVAATLRANLARNGLTRVEVLEAAVVSGDEVRNVALNLPDEGRKMPVGAHLVDDVEVVGRSTRTQIVVPGLPIRQLADGRDLIKIDAEGIEAVLLADIRALLVDRRPNLLIEVLPEAKRLGEMLAALASEANYQIHVLPAWGSDRIVTVPAASFTSELPRTYNSKDVVLSTGPLN
ncbi:FkbM family methyltransferase [Reyranella sp.]|uniref:FkbM family methyltransferase n=1 Tax=Reyranella sp. TaxID=1929291 RepID=UPI003D147E03